jgi:hypothetical protein
MDFLSLIYQSMWGLKMQVSTPKSSGCRPNLREWWVGEKKLPLITMQGNGLSMDVGILKKNEDLPCLQSGGKSKFEFLAIAFLLRIS